MRRLLRRGSTVPALAGHLVTFTAPCPTCGRDAEWESLHTPQRIRDRINCPVCGKTAWTRTENYQ